MVEPQLQGVADTVFILESYALAETQKFTSPVEREDRYWRKIAIFCLSHSDKGEIILFGKEKQVWKAS